MSTISGVLVLAFAMSYLCVPGDGLDVTLVEWSCDDGWVPETGDSMRAITDLITQLINITPLEDYSFKDWKQRGDDRMWGHANCSPNLWDKNDCSKCLVIADGELKHSCPFRKGARVKLRDCKMRYHNYDFDPNW
ncbi:hypothetical protein MLD38_024855 [Melastoma candidum]|uniref:Uncharacterized protein n=1 Tax=Melastoma candidum TaxID=119954 RepID=A0ACB9NTB3_9MYRT|nr:hypothetical protein MLD38_024855 [Melastoma candidum]